MKCLTLADRALNIFFYAVCDFRVAVQKVAKKFRMSVVLIGIAGGSASGTFHLRLFTFR